MGKLFPLRRKTLIHSFIHSFISVPVATVYVYYRPTCDTREDVSRPTCDTHEDVSRPTIQFSHLEMKLLLFEVGPTV